MTTPMSLVIDPQATGDAVLVHEAVAPGAPAGELTIAIPTFRRPELLVQAVQSIARQTSLAGVEVLIVDNDPEGDSTEVVARLRALDLPNLRYFRNGTNVGMFGNWNRCIALCRTEWLSILNDDDMLLPAFVEEMARLRQRVDSIAYACRCQVLDERPREKRGNRRLGLVNRLRALQSRAPVSRFACLDYFLRNRHYGSLGIVFRRRVAFEMDGFAASYYPSSDYNFFSSLATRGPISFLHKPLASYRIAVNESLKLETIERWREIDATIRRQLGRHVSAPGWMKERYVRLAATQEYLARTRESKIVDAQRGAFRQGALRWRTALTTRLLALAVRAHHWTASRHPRPRDER